MPFCMEQCGNSLSYNFETLVNKNDFPTTRHSYCSIAL